MFSMYIYTNQSSSYDYLFSLFCESMCALVYAYIERERERESLTRVWHAHGLHKMSTSPVLLLHAPHMDEPTCHIMWRLVWDDFTDSLYRTQTSSGPLRLVISCDNRTGLISGRSWGKPFSPSDPGFQCVLIL